MPPAEVSKARIWDRNYEWEYAQTNFDLIWEDEPAKEQVVAARAALKNEPQVGFELCLALAEQGCVSCMGTVASAYYHGRGVAPDTAMAESWWARGAAAGSTFDLLNYRIMIQRRRDFAAGAAAMAPAAADGWPPALFWLAWFRLKLSRTRKTFLWARPLLERAAACGGPAAQWELARHMARGRFGVLHMLRGVRLLTAFAIESLAIDDSSAPPPAKFRPLPEP